MTTHANTYAKDNARLIEKFADAAHLVLGYEFVIRGRHDEKGYLARLYAADKQGNVYTRLTTDPDTFHHPSAIWENAGGVPDERADRLEFIGHYERAKMRIKS